MSKRQEQRRADRAVNKITEELPFAYEGPVAVKLTRKQKRALQAALTESITQEDNNEQRT